MFIATAPPRDETTTTASWVLVELRRGGPNGLIEVLIWQFRVDDFVAEVH